MGPLAHLQEKGTNTDVRKITIFLNNIVDDSFSKYSLPESFISHFLFVLGSVPGFPHFGWNEERTPFGWISTDILFNNPIK